MKKLLLLMLIVASALLTSISSFGASPKSSSPKCSKEMREQFRDLYLSLAEKLNYSGKDAIHDKNGKITLSFGNHKDKEDYSGQIFEKILYHEHQNSLKKVAKLLQGTDKKLDTSDSSLLKSYPEVIKFLQSTDDNVEGLKNVNINKFVAELQTKSQSKFNNETDKKYIINDNDVYLLKKLLIHAHDMTVRYEKYEQRKADPKKYKKTKYDDQYAAAGVTPLKGMLLALKNRGGISDKSDLTLNEDIDTDKALKETINAQMDQLKKWLNEHQDCKEVIKKNPSYIQNGIQASNFARFIDALSCTKHTPPSTLDPGAIQNIEALLQFINANQKHGKIEPKAETGFNLKALQDFTDRTFEIAKEKPVIVIDSEKTDAICKAEGDAKNPKEDLVPSADKTKCEKKAEAVKPEEKTDAICKAEGDAKNPKEILVPSADKTKCEKKADAVKPEEKCTMINGREMSSTEKRDCLVALEKPKDNEEDSPSIEYTNRPAPVRFVPVQIPTRQMYILPGMP